MKFFFYAELSDNGFDGGLDAASVQWLVNQMGIFQPSFTVWEDEMRMFVNGPEIFQNMQCVFRQGHQPVFVALGVANMNPHIDGVDIADSQPDSFTKPQPHAVGGKEKNFVAQLIGCRKQPVELLDGQNIRNPGCLWRFDQGDVLPGFVQYSGVKELQAIQIKLDRTPGMAFQKFVEIIKQLIGCKLVNPAIEIVSDTPDGP